MLYRALTLEPDNGFGFKLAGASPCTVSEVTPGKSVFNAFRVHSDYNKLEWR